MVGREYERAISPAKIKPLNVLWILGMAEGSEDIDLEEGELVSSEEEEEGPDKNQVCLLKYHCTY